MGFLGDASTGILTGAIMKSPMMSVAKEGGPTIYFNAHPDLSVMLARVEKAGGRIIMPKTKISDDIGYMAMFIDSEGNRLALHSIG